MRDDFVYTGTHMDAVAKLASVLEKVPALLNSISHAQVAKQPSGDKWSKKQELGHLVDSACNNHQRIVRAQLETESTLPGYDGDRWVTLHNYQGMEWKEIIECWRVMNQHLLPAAQAISPQSADRKLSVGAKEMSLDFLVTDYVDHLLHHLAHIGVDVS
jgi:DinB family protein